jgi:hypothetical protein
VVEHREGEGLQEHALGERRADGQHRRAGEEEVALGVAVDVAAEAEVGQPVQQAPVGDPLRPEGGQLVVPEPEARQLLQQAAGAGEDAVPAAVREAAGEHLEDAVPVGRPVGEGGGDHRQLVPVGEQGGCRAGRSGGRHGTGA